MSVFAQIDARLAQFAATQQALLTRDRNGDSLRPTGPNGTVFEERRIDWQRDDFNLALIIQPDFGGADVDSSKWHLVALAWKYVPGGSGKRTAMLHLVNGRPFGEIETRVEELLAEAGTYLNGLQARDLKPVIDLHHQREVRRQRAERRQ